MTIIIKYVVTLPNRSGFFMTFGMISQPLRTKYSTIDMAVMAKTHLDRDFSTGSPANRF